jgi:uncharacterized FlaG/YvyC family protein
MAVDAVSIISGADTATVSKGREFPKIPAGPSGTSGVRAQTAMERLRTDEEMQKEIEGLIKDFAVSNRLSMHYDGDINRVVVTITNGNTQEVIRQIPSAEFIAFMKRFKEVIGLMVDRRV